MRIHDFKSVLLLVALLLVSVGCERPRPFKRAEPEPPPKYVQIPPSEVPALSQSDFLRRKATLGSRTERFEALDVIDRSADPELIPFLIERLEKEDDSILQIRIMQALANAQDVRAVEPLRRIARWNETRMAVVAVESLYELGDDNFIPRLFVFMKQGEDFPELAGIAYRTLKKIYQVELPSQIRIWNNYFRSHRLAPYQQLKWYASFRPPIPPVVEGTTRVEPHTRGPRLPPEEVSVRRHLVSAYEFWKPDEP